MAARPTIAFLIADNGNNINTNCILTPKSISISFFSYYAFSSSSSQVLIVTREASPHKRTSVVATNDDFFEMIYGTKHSTSLLSKHKR
ncbi:hypothetical protein E1A91_A06G133600v1 [Gossypium mustelinum]|uniref:Uncharacterized protein n=1 Tax=Gossypium mustelinum TaxID=34275 RepID=A0A5D2YVD3_GOSMU|nr:hypothetical protein E1A91_A06G133600v1 [Gossypium mustelinum]